LKQIKASVPSSGIVSKAKVANDWVYGRKWILNSNLICHSDDTRPAGNEAM